MVIWVHAVRGQNVDPASRPAFRPGAVSITVLGGWAGDLKALADLETAAGQLALREKA